MSDPTSATPDPRGVPSPAGQPASAPPGRWLGPRRLALLGLAAAGLALLGTPQVTRPPDRYTLGEFTSRAIRAPYDLSVVDDEATRQQRATAAAAAPIVVTLDAQVAARLEARFTEAWAPLARLLPDATETAAAASTPVTGRSAAARRAAEARAMQEREERARRVNEAFTEAQQRLGTDIPADVRAVTADRAALEMLFDRFRALVDKAYVVPVVADLAAFRRLRPVELPTDASAHVVLVDPATGREQVRTDERQWRDVAGAQAALEAQAATTAPGLPPPVAEWLLSLVASWLQPNVTLDAAATVARRRAAVDAILLVSLSFRRNELIVGEGQPVTRQTLLVLDHLRQQRLGRLTWRRLAGRAGVIFALLVLAFGTARGGRMRLALDAGHFTFVVTSLVATAVAFRAWVEVVDSMAGTYPVLPEAALVLCFPAIGAVMYASMVLPPQAAMAYLVVQALCLGLIWQLELLYVVYLLVAGGIASLLVWHCSRRQCVVRAGLATALVIGPLAACLVLLTDATGATLLWTPAGAMAGCVLSALAVLGVSPLFEWMFGHLTRIRLVELMNYQHPLLRRVTEVTPGTFQHSVTVGLLADAAANAIGADALLARVGALYHDAGKTVHPDHFTENQQGVNPHDQMSARDSARAIIGHVGAGVRLVREFGLGERIADFVREHHGTATVRSFLVKAQQAGEAVDVAEFSYPGPRPRSRETAILMIADQVEATARAMDAPTEDALRAMVRSTIDRIAGERQFDECPLTLQELATIGDTLTQVLQSVHHRRVKYPSDQGVTEPSARSRQLMTDN